MITYWRIGTRPLVAVLVMACFVCAAPRDAFAATTTKATKSTTAAKTVKPVKKKASAPAPLEIAGWIPYWRKATGTQEALVHLATFKELSPFGYTVKHDGTLFDAMKVDEEPWPSFIATAREQKVKIIPTVMWANAEDIDRVLRSKKLRTAHIKEIVAVVKEHNFDGVDIDYEGKKAETRKYFSLFLKELYAAMGKKIVSCSIEARTPLDARYDTIPENIEYANDYMAINKYCDRVRIMTYDQGMIDLKLNRAESGLYVPTADPQWVEKVVTLAAKTISKKKIVIGVPTYGYEYEVIPLTEGYRFKLLWAFNPKYATDLATSLGMTPMRNRAGEQSFVYNPVTLTPPAAVDTTPGDSNNPFVAVASAQTTAILSSPTTTPMHMVWWSDAQAIADKVALAKKLGVRGVAIFKIDGGADPALWTAIR